MLVSCGAVKNSNGLKTDLRSNNLKGNVQSYTLRIEYVEGYDKTLGQTRVVTPGGEISENAFVEYNKAGQMINSLIGSFDDNLKFNSYDLSYMISYKYHDKDIKLKRRPAAKFKVPNNFPQEFYAAYPDFCLYYRDTTRLKLGVIEIYRTEYDKKSNLNEVIKFRKFYNKIDTKVFDDGNEMRKLLADENKQQHWKYEYDNTGRLKKCTIYKLGMNDIPLQYFRESIRSPRTDVIFNYDPADRLNNYTLYDSNKNKIGSVTYTYDEKDNGVSELIYKSDPPEYYLASVHYRERKYNEQGDLIADLLKVEPEFEELVRVKQKYNDKYFVYEYDSNFNWIKCDIYLNTLSSEKVCTMYREIKYY